MDDKYFLDKGFIKNGEDIYLYKNFLTEDELNVVVPILDDHRINHKFNRDMDGTPFENKITQEIRQLAFISKRLKDMFMDKYMVNENLTVNVLAVGDSWGEHSDSHDFIEKRKQSEMLKDGDPYEIIEDSRYGIVIYFNTPEEGGDLEYTGQNIIYTPKPGDLVIHSAEENCKHRVNQIIKGHRYSHSSHLGVDLKVPISV
jgi:hypothetical protein